LIGGWLSHVHSRYRTPVRAIVVFAGVAALEAIFGFMTGEKALETMADMYAFGAMLAYLLASIALVALRIREPRTPRAYRVPFNVLWKGIDIPLPGILAIVGTAGMIVIVLWTHSVARILGPLWVLAWVAYYVWHRHRSGLPKFGSTKHDWESDQLEILADTGEWELYEQFKIEVERKKRNNLSAPKVPEP